MGNFPEESMFALALGVGASPRTGSIADLDAALDEAQNIG
jgi:hypothetical protein